MPNAHESTDPWPAPPQEDRSSPDPSSALQALQPLCFTQALFDNRSALEAVLAHLFTPSFEDFADFEDAELEMIQTSVLNPLFRPAGQQPSWPFPTRLVRTSSVL